MNQLLKSLLLLFFFSLINSLSAQNENNNKWLYYCEGNSIFYTESSFFFPYIQQKNEDFYVTDCFDSCSNISIVNNNNKIEVGDSLLYIYDIINDNRKGVCYKKIDLQDSLSEEDINKFSTENNFSIINSVIPHVSSTTIINSISYVGSTKINFIEYIGNNIAVLKTKTVIEGKVYYSNEHIVLCKRYNDTLSLEWIDYHFDMNRVKIAKQDINILSENLLLDYFTKRKKTIIMLYSE